MRHSLVALAMVVAIPCCERPLSFNKEAALTWSNESNVQSRQKADAYSFQRDDGTWVTISTAKLNENDTGLEYRGGEILDTGYFTYPGGRKAKTIHQAIEICLELKGAKYKANKPEMATPRKPSDKF